MLSNANNSDAYILEKGKLSMFTPKYYGKDNDAVLYELMGVTKRIDSMTEKIDNLFKAIEDENIELSEQLYSELVDILGDDDSDLVRAKMQIDYLNEFSIE